MAVALVVRCLVLLRRSLGGERVERWWVVLDPPHGGQLDNVEVERVGEGPGEHPWGGSRGLGARCGPRFVGCDGSIGVGGE